MPNKGEDLSNERIADYYTSLLHVSGADLTNFEYGITDLLSPNDVYDGVGNTTGLALSALHDRVIINNYIYPEGYDDLLYPDGSIAHGQGATEWLDAFFPIGVIVLTADNNDPSNRIAGTQWCKIDPPAQFLVGIGTSTDEHGDVYRFAQHAGQPLNGDLAGEYAHQLTVDELPAHYHVANTNRAVLGPQGGNDGGTDLSFFFYFGPPVNQAGHVVTNSPTKQSYQGQDLITAFQNNTRFDTGIEGVGYVDKYRDWLIRWRYDYQDEETGLYPYRFYTDTDFQPTLGPNLPGSLVGWGQAVAAPDRPGGVDGPGWAGFLDKTTETGGWRDFPEQVMTADRFITNSPRPVNVPWTVIDAEGRPILNDDGSPHRERILQAHSGWQRYGLDKIHPGTFTPRQLIIARNYLMNVLGEDDAHVALSQVQRLIDMDETVQHAIEKPPVDPTKMITIPGFNELDSQNAGGSDWHNNIPPNYGVYAWRRVEPGIVCHTTRREKAPPWYGTITRDIISTGPDDVFNLGEWAKEWNQNTDEELGNVRRGWNGRQPAYITIAGADKSEMVDASGNPRPVYIYSDDTSNSVRHGDGEGTNDAERGSGGPGKVPAMIIEDFPWNLTLINNGFIMGRGGDGGYKGDPSRVPHGSGQDGGDAIHITGRRGKITIQNANGGIGGGGGGGAGGSSPGGHGVTSSGGGGGAGGGQGGTSWAFDPRRGNNRDPLGLSRWGGVGGGPGERGENGRYYVWGISTNSFSSCSTCICTDFYGPLFDVLPGIGGEAGGSGANAGGKLRRCNGTGGGGGRVLTRDAIGGGTGGPPGAPFGGLNADGTVKGFGDGPEFANNSRAYISTQPLRGWTGGYNVGVQPRGLGRNGYEAGYPRPAWLIGNTQTRIPQNYGARWVALERTTTNNARGYHTPATGLPWIRAACIGYNPNCCGGARVTKYLSDTGWNGAYHYSTYVAGGWADKPGLPAGPDPEEIPTSYARGTYTSPQLMLAGKGGGGWGADGGMGAGEVKTGEDRHLEDLRLATGGRGGWAVRKPGGMPCEINGGIVYGHSTPGISLNQVNR